MLAAKILLGLLATVHTVTAHPNHRALARDDIHHGSPQPRCRLIKPDDDRTSLPKRPTSTRTSKGYYSSTLTTTSATTTYTYTTTSSHSETTTSTKSTLTTPSSVTTSSTTPTTTDSTLTSSSTTSSSQPVQTGFKIQIQTRTAGKLRRLVLYVKFVGDEAIVVENESEASTFIIEDGYLMFGDEYVTNGGSSGYSTFSKSLTRPSEAGEWSSAGGSVTFSRAQGFCTTSDGALVMIKDQQPPFTCNTVSLVQDTSLTPPSSSPTTSSTTPTLTTTPTTQTSRATKELTPGGTWSGSTTTRTTTTTIDCTPSVYTATSRCSCRWSVRCNSHAVSEFNFQPSIVSATSSTDCIEQCNANPKCGGLWFDPGKSACYIFDSDGDNVLYAYNSGPWFAASPLDCDPACAASPTTTLVRTTTTTSPTPVATGCRYEEYQARSGGCNCVWPIKCGTQVLPGTGDAPTTQLELADHHACVDLCDATSKCQLFTYDPNTKICRLWDNGDQPAAAVAGIYWAARLDNWCPASQCPS